MRALDYLMRRARSATSARTFRPGASWRPASRAMNVSRFISCQDEYSLVVRDIEKGYVPCAQEYLGLLFFPLARWLAAQQKGEAAPNDTRFDKAAARTLRHAAQRGHRRWPPSVATPRARLLLASVAAASSVIAGATRVEQVEQNVKDRLKLERKNWRRSTDNEIVALLLSLFFTGEAKMNLPHQSLDPLHGRAGSPPAGVGEAEDDRAARLLSPRAGRWSAQGPASEIGGLRPVGDHATALHRAVAAGQRMVPVP